MASRRRWSQIGPRLDVDAFEEAIGWEPIDTDNKGNDIGYCPDLWGLHKNGDSTGKFAIHREKRVYNCWVCGGGSLLSLAMEIKKLDEPTAIDWISEFAGSESAVTNEDFESEIEAMLAEHDQQEAALPYFNPRVLDRWTGRPHPWFDERGISEKVVEDYRLGFDPVGTRITKKGTYEGPAIIIPHFWGQKLVGWQCRWLAENRPKWVNKYTNTTDFPRERTLFNYEAVYFSPQPIVVCESATTALRLTGLDIPAIATFGAEVTPQQVRLLKLCQQGLLPAPDNDKPGRKWARTVTEGVRRHVSVGEIELVGEEDSGNDLSDLDDDQEIVDRYTIARQEVE